MLLSISLHYYYKWIKLIRQVLKACVQILIFLICKFRVNCQVTTSFVSIFGYANKIILDNTYECTNVCQGDLLLYKSMTAYFSLQGPPTSSISAKILPISREHAKSCILASLEKESQLILCVLYTSHTRSQTKQVFLAKFPSSKAAKNMHFVIWLYRSLLAQLLITFACICVIHTGHKYIVICIKY